MSQASATATDEQFAARELVRSWAAGSNAVKAAREIEQGDPQAWRAPYAGLAQLGIFGVALPEEAGGAGGTVDDLCAMVDEAAAAMVPGPIASTAVATLVVPSSRADLLEALASGERTAGMALSADLKYADGRASGTRRIRAGRRCRGRAAAARVRARIRPRRRRRRRRDRRTTDPDRLLPPARRVVLDDAAAEVLPVSRRRVEDLAATVLAAEAAGLARWTLQTATEYAKVREQFGKPIGSFQAVKHMCAEMLLRSEQVAVAAGRRGPCRQRVRRSAAVDRSSRRRRRGHRAGEGQRQGLHPGARRHRHHLGARRASVSASGIRHFAVPRRPVALAAPCRGAHAAGCPPRTAHRLGVGRASAARNRRRGRRCRRAARSRSGRSRSPRPGCRPRTGRDRTAATPRPPSSC